MALSTLNPAPQCLGQASTGSTGTVLQGGALAPITTTQKTAQSAPGFYMCYLNTLAKQAQAGAASACAAGPIQAQSLQNQAYCVAAKNAGSYQPGINAATATANQAAGSCISQMAQNYMNPYTKCVVNAIGNLGQANIAQNLAPQATAGIVGSGQFGSQRGAGALGQVIANADLGITGQQACALKTGYAQSLCAANKQINNQLNAGKLQSCLASTQSALGINCAKALATLGQCQYTVAQNKALYPLSVAKAESCVLKGYSVPMATSCIKTAPIPGAYATSPLAQVAGLGSLASGILGRCGISSLGSLFGGNPNRPSGVPSNYVYDSTNKNWIPPAPGQVFDSKGNLVTGTTNPNAPQYDSNGNLISGTESGSTGGGALQTVVYPQGLTDSSGNPLPSEPTVPTDTTPSTPSDNSGGGASGHMKDITSPDAPISLFNFADGGSMLVTKKSRRSKRTNKE